MLMKTISLFVLGILATGLTAGNHIDYMANLKNFELEEDYENHTVLKYEINNFMTYKYYVKSIDGSILQYQELNSIPGKNEVLLELEKLEKGKYWIVLESNDEIYTEEIYIK